MDSWNHGIMDSWIHGIIGAARRNKDKNIYNTITLVVLYSVLFIELNHGQSSITCSKSEL
jgi:hypothetical protein